MEIPDPTHRKSAAQSAKIYIIKEFTTTDANGFARRILREEVSKIPLTGKTHNGNEER